jgi:curved DNA-binding protein CbpA
LACCFGRRIDYGSGMNDLYEVLQVRHGAEPEVIRAAYRALARKYHPDFGGSPQRMASINEAWAVLGDETQRAAYDARPKTASTGPAQATTTAAASAAEPPPAPARTGGLSGRRPADPRDSGSVLDFGRYAGWTVGRLVDHDPDYLVWLARTPIGRRLTAEIETALTNRESAAAALRPAPQPQPRHRSFIRPWATAGSAAR